MVSLLESGRQQRWSQQRVFEKPSWAQKLLRYVLVCALVSSVIDSSCYTDYDFSASLNQLFLQDANGRKHTRDGTTSSLAHAGHEIQTLCVQNTLIASLVTSLSMSPADSMNRTVSYGLGSEKRSTMIPLIGS